MKELANLLPELCGEVAVPASNVEHMLLCCPTHWLPPTSIDKGCRRDLVGHSVDSATSPELGSLDTTAKELSLRREPIAVEVPAGAQPRRDRIAVVRLLVVNETPEAPKTVSSPGIQLAPSL